MYKRQVKYKTQCDTLASFIRESFDVDENSTINVSQYYHNFKQWYSQEYSSIKGILTKSEFCQLFIDNTNGDEITGRVTGYRFKEFDETDSGI